MDMLNKNIIVGTFVEITGRLGLHEVTGVEPSTRTAVHVASLKGNYTKQDIIRFTNAESKAQYKTRKLISISLERINSTIPETDLVFTCVQGNTRVSDMLDLDPNAEAFFEIVEVNDREISVELRKVHMKDDSNE